MILARNRHQLLNGNNFLLAGFLILSLSCHTALRSKDSQISTQKKETPPEHKKTPVEPMDTVQWTIKDKPKTDTKIPVEKELLQNSTEIDRTISELKSIYKVLFLVPQYSNLKPESNENLTRMAHFTMGSKMAISDFPKLKTTIEIDLFDIELYKNRMQNLIKNDSLDHYDAFVGPYKTEDIKLLQEFTKGKNKWIFSPWNTNNSLLMDEPNYVQLKPGIEAHCESISKHISEHYPKVKTYVVCEKSDEREQGYFQFFKNSQHFRSNKLLAARLELLLVDGESGLLESKSLSEAYKEDLHNIYIIPYWANHTFVLKFLESMGPYLLDKSNVTVYGLPQWLHFQQIQMELYDRYNIRLSAHAYYNTAEFAEGNFRKRFFEAYNTIPLEDAFYGYELTYWLIQTINQNGLNSKGMNNVFTDLPFYPMDLREYIAPGSSPRDVHKQINGFENRYTYMIKLQNYRFVLSDQN